MKSIAQLSFCIIAVFVCGMCRPWESSNFVFKTWWVIIYRSCPWISYPLTEVMESSQPFHETHLFSFPIRVLWTRFKGRSRRTQKAVTLELVLSHAGGTCLPCCQCAFRWKSVCIGDVATLGDKTCLMGMLRVRSAWTSSKRACPMQYHEAAHFQGLDPNFPGQV